MNSAIILLFLLSIFAKENDAQSQNNCDKYCDRNCEDYYYTSQEYQQCIQAHKDYSCDANDNTLTYVAIVAGASIACGLAVCIILTAISDVKNLRNSRGPVQPNVTITSAPAHPPSEVCSVGTTQEIYSTEFSNSETPLPDYEQPPSYYEVVREN